MEYRKTSNRVYIRMDKGDEILSGIRKVCRELSIKSGTFQGIGACGKAAVATFIPERQDFLHHECEGMLEMISLLGNIVTDDEGELKEHAHGMFSQRKESGKIGYLGGHVVYAWVSYTAELTLDIVPDGFIGHKADPFTGIDVWKLEG